MTENREQQANALIRALIDTEQSASPDETQRILATIAEAPFANRFVRVPGTLRGKEYAGYRFGSSAPSDLVHLAKRVLVERQWAESTTLEDYHRDLRAAVTDENARIALYRSRGLHRLGILAPNKVPRERLGQESQPWLWVLYDIDHGTITTGYQVSGLETLSLPRDTRWLSQRER